MLDGEAMASDPPSSSATDNEVLELIHSVQQLEEDNGFSMPGITPAFDVDLDSNRPQADDLDICDDSLQAIRTKLTQIHQTIQPKDGVDPGTGGLCFSQLFGAAAAEVQAPKKGRKPKKRAGATFQCDLCQQVFRIKNSLRAHVAEHFQRPRRKCSSCGETLQTTTELVDHFVANHLSPEAPQGLVLGSSSEQSTVQELQCSVCKETFSKPSSLRKHLQCHRDSRPFECPVCKNTFKEKFILKCHLKLHEGEDIVECTVCSKPYTDRGELLNHFAIHALGKNFLPCSDCDLSFPSKALLLFHRKTHKVVKDHCGLYDCPVCGKTCAKRSTLSRHFRIHSGLKPHSCSRCPKAFGTRKQLTVHFRTHSGERPYCCDVCGKRFPFSHSLTTHLRIHTGRAAHACRYCDKTFTQRSNMRRHLKQHLEECDLQCGACREVFDSRREYNRHLGSHRTSPPEDLTCFHCGKVFTHTSNLARHLKLHILYCDICCRTFEARDQLLRHLRQHEKRSDPADMEGSKMAEPESPQCSDTHATSLEQGGRCAENYVQPPNNALVAEPAVVCDADKKKKFRWSKKAMVSWEKASQLVFLAVAGLTAWGVGYCLLGEPLSPVGGPLFNMCLMFVLAQLAGWLAGLARLPSLLGMIVVGIVLRNTGFFVIVGKYVHVAAVLRQVALVVILIRAGLGLDPAALRRLSGMVARLAVVPSIAEITTIGVLGHFLLDLPWIWSFMLGGVLAAVSPAVVIPCLFSLSARGYGVDKGVPTLIVAAASFDDIIAIAVFGVLVSVIFSTGSLAMQIIRGPVGIVMGLVFGFLWGLMARHVPSQHASWLVGSRTLLLGGGGLVAVLGSEAIGFDGAGPLGCIVAAFVSCYGWRADGWSDDNNPVGENFSLLWQFLQPILFSLIGTEIDLFVLEGHTVGLGLACLLLALLAKLLLSVVSALGGNLNWKEKLFVSIAWFPKATVQAALGPVALDMARTLHSDADLVHAHKVLVVAVLAILVTAPLGAIMITLLGPRLLTKTERPVQAVELARGH